MPVALAIRERGRQEAGELAGDGGVPAVPGGARRGVSEALVRLAQDPLLVLSQPTQCQTLRSGQGDAAPPLNPQLPGPLPGQRAVGAAIANRVAGAIPADRLSVTGAARAHARRSTPPIGTRPRRQAVTRSPTWTALGP